MASQYDSSVKPYIATAAIDPYLVVYKTGASLNEVSVIATAASDVPIGVTVNAAAAGYPVAVRLLNSGGTVLIKAAAAIAAGATVRQIAGGTVDDTGTTAIIGTAEEAATAAGDIIEVLLA